MFYHLTYEGAVDIDSVQRTHRQLCSQWVCQVQDEHERRSLTDQIMNFGQTPSQIFDEPHPARLPRNRLAQPLYRAPESVVGKHVHKVGYAAGQIELVEGKLRTCPLHSQMLLPRADTYMCYWRDDGCVTFGAVKEKRKAEGNPVCRLHQGRLSALSSTRDSKTVVTGGEDSVVHVWDLLHDTKKEEWTLRHRGSLFGHRASISSVTVSREHGVVLSGDTDGLVML